MKSMKGTLVFAAIVAVVAGIAFNEFKKSEVEKAGEKTAKHLLKNLQIPDVEELKYSSTRLNYIFRQENKIWTATQPFQDRLDTEAAEGLLREIATADVQEVSLESVDWGKYGLVTADAEITLSLKGGVKHKVAVGTIRSYDEGFYLRWNDGNKLLVTGKAFESVVNKDPMSVRSKKLVLPENEWLGLAIDSKVKDHAGKYTFQVQNGLWTSLEKPKVSLSQTAFADFRNSLEDFKADEIVSDKNSSADRAKFGLSTPEFSLTIEGRTGDINKGQILISRKKDQFVYLTSTLSQPIYKASKRNVEFIYKGLNEFRDHSIPFRLDGGKVTKMTWKDSAKKLDVILRKDGVNWVHEVKSGIKNINSSAVEDMLKIIPTLIAADYSRPSGTVDAGQIEFFDAANQSLFKMSYGKLYKIKDSEYYLVKTSISDENFGVSRMTFDGLVNREVFVKDNPPTASNSNDGKVDNK